jgi:hypothetical protein
MVGPGVLCLNETFQFRLLLCFPLHESLFYSSDKDVYDRDYDERDEDA